MEQDPIDKSKVLDVRPLRCLAPVLPSASGISSAASSQPMPFTCVPPSGPFPSGFQPFFPFLAPNGTQQSMLSGQNQPDNFVFGSRIPAPIPLNSFRTPTSQANGGTGQRKRPVKPHASVPIDVEDDGFSDSLNGLKELETLEATNNRPSDGLVRLADVSKLVNLRKLVIKMIDMDSASILAHYMCNNENQLRESYLTIRNCDFSSEEGEVIFKNILMSPSLVSLAIYLGEFRCGFPSYHQGMCKNLVFLGIYNSKIEDELMGILGKYPKLRNLNLNAESQPNMICFANSFPELKSLSLIRISSLRKWEVEERAMPKLTRLLINGCKNLEGLPLISTLRELMIHGMPKEFNDKLRVVNGQPGEDYHKISHIPSLILLDK